MSYIGSTPTTQSFIAGTDYFNGNGSTTAFTLSRPVVSVNDIQAVVNNVVQVPNDAYNVSGSTITFTSAPSSGTGNVYVRYLSTTTQSITPSQNTVSYSTWNSDLRNQTFAFKNRLINGDMVIDQRNNGAAVTVNNTNLNYSVDRWWGTGKTSDGVYTMQRSTSTPPAGFSNFLRITVTTADASIAAGDTYYMGTKIEGFNVTDLSFGSANAQTITISFWARSSVTGTFSGALLNGAENRSYPFTFAINAANTWEYETITIVGDTTGTWATDNTAGMVLALDLGSGSNFRAAAGSWVAAGEYGATGAVTLISTLNATLDITGVQLEKGFTATNFDYLPYGTELALCQRYFELFTLKDYSLVGQCYSSASAYVTLHFTVQKRTTPTATLPPTGSGANQITFVNSTMSIPSTIGSNLATEFSISKLNILGTGYTGAFTAGNATMLYTSGSPVIQISAEL